MKYYSKFYHVFICFLTLSFTFQQPLYAIEQSDNAVDNESKKLEKIIIDHFKLLKTFSQEELENAIVLIYNKAIEMNLDVESLPQELRMCAQCIINKKTITYEEALQGVHSYIHWVSKAINDHLKHDLHEALPITFHDELIKDYPDTSENQINRGGKGCCCAVLTMLNQILSLNVQIISLIGSPFGSSGGGLGSGDPCSTIFGILGDACTILGENISEALLDIKTCCSSLETLTSLSSLVNELNDTVTTLAVLTVEINETLTTIQALSVVLESTATTLTEIQNTLTTCCNNTTTQIADLKSTVTNDFQSTWTILGDVGVILGRGATISGTLLNIMTEVNTLTACCNGTFTSIADLKSTITNDFQDTWTILGDVGVILGRSATISGTLLNIMTEVNTLTACCNSTLTSLTDIKSTITNDFQDTWTILGDVGVILGRGATISGTLLNIMTEVNTLTACCNGTFTSIADLKSTITNDFQDTWTILGDVGVILGRSATISGTLLNIMSEINTLTACCASTLTTLGDAGLILGPSATISGTLLSIYDIVNAENCGATLIHASDLDTTGYTINSPGVYKLAENIDFNTGATRAILINSSDVILDLQCFILSSNNVLVGIDSVSNFSNITIKNGTIRGFTTFGIRFNGTYSGVTIDNVNFVNLPTSAILFLGVTTSIIKNCNFNLCSTTSTAGSNFVIQLLLSNILEISSCKILNTESTISVTAVKVSTNCTDVTLDHVISTGGSGSSYTAFAVDSSASNCIFNNCASIQDSATGALTSFSIAGGNQTLNQCFVTKGSAANIIGYQISSSLGAAVGCNITDCSATGAFNGFSLNGSTLYTINNSIVNGNSGTGGLFGIFLNNSTNSIVKNSQISENQSGAVATGIGLQTNSNNNSILDCDVIRNTGSNDANSFGINLVSGTNNLFSRCRAYFNGSTVNNQLSGLPLGSIANQNTTNLNAATNPWGNIGIVP